MGTQAKEMSKMKKEDRLGAGCVDQPPTKKAKSKQPSDDELRATEFKGYDVSELPSEALPMFGHEYKGSHSYTVHIQGAVSWLIFIGDKKNLIRIFAEKSSDYLVYNNTGRISYLYIPQIPRLFNKRGVPKLFHSVAGPPSLGIHTCPGS